MTTDYRICPCDIERDLSDRITEIRDFGEGVVIKDCDSKNEAMRRFCRRLDSKAKMPYSVKGFNVGEIYRLDRKIAAFSVENNCISHNGASWTAAYSIKDV